MIAEERIVHEHSPGCKNDEHDEGNAENEKVIKFPGPHDVLLGRGGATNNHVGNVQFRIIVSNHKMRYLASSKVDKPKVARDVVKIWRNLNPPGRFLQRRDDTKKGPGSVQDECIVWIEVDDGEARKKASQCLRERTPDVKPYIELMNKKRTDESEEKGEVPAKQLGTKVKKDLTLDYPDSRDGDKNEILNLFDPSVNNSMLGACMPHQPLTINTNLTLIGDMLDRRLHFNTKLRRGSLPALAHMANQGFDGMSTMGSTIRSQDRRSSLPAMSQLQGQQARAVDSDQLLAHQEKVLRDAYTAIERTGDVNASHLASMQIQQQLLTTRQLMMQTQYMNMKARMLNATDGLPDRMGAQNLGMPQQGNGLAGFPHQMSGPTQQQLLQQQQILAQQQRQLLAMQEGLVRQEHINITAQPQEVRSSAAVSGHNGSRADFAEVDELEPLPIHHEPLSIHHNIYLSGPLLADEPTSNGGLPNAGLQLAPMHEAASPKAKKREASGEHRNIAPSTVETVLKPEAGAFHDEEQNHAGNAPDSTVKDKPPTDPSDALPEYRKTLEAYISTNQGSFPSLDDVNDSGMDQRSKMANGVATSEWIEEQLLNSGCNSSADLSIRGRRTVQRSNSKKSFLSTGVNTEMSLSFSDMEYTVDLSTKGDSRRTATRSMSIASHNSHMSELTDFDELEDTL